MNIDNEIFSANDKREIKSRQTHQKNSTPCLVNPLSVIKNLDFDNFVFEVYVNKGSVVADSQFVEVYSLSEVLRASVKDFLASSVSSLYRLATALLTSRPGLMASSSVSLMFFNISSIFFRSLSLRIFSSNNFLVASDQFTSFNESISFFISSGTDNVIFMHR